MIRTLPFLIAALLVLSWTGASFGQTSAPAQGSERKVRVGKTVYDFEEVDILGQLKKPEGQSILEPPEVSFRRLLDLDESFLPNIVRGADEF
ncbi:MAG TPA: hypothetical protein VI895_05400 [Bdellovibrionota bacterium]|nr:hypothetical protein [Bdellovibrionota bacterium]